MKKILFIIFTLFLSSSCELLLVLSISNDEAKRREKAKYQVAVAVDNTEIGPCALVLNECLGYVHDTIFIKQARDRYIIFKADTCKGPNGFFARESPIVGTNKSYMEVYKYLQDDKLDTSPYKVWKPNQTGFFSYPKGDWEFRQTTKDDLTTYLYLYHIL